MALRGNLLSSISSDSSEGLVSSLETDWSITLGRPYEGGSEAFVAEATLADGTSAVLKVLVPGAGNDPSNEATVLRLADGGRMSDALPVRRRPGRPAHGTARPAYV